MFASIFNCGRTIFGDHNAIDCHKNTKCKHNWNLISELNEHFDGWDWTKANTFDGDCFKLFIFFSSRCCCHQCALTFRLMQYFFWFFSVRFDSMNCQIFPVFFFANDKEEWKTTKSIDRMKDIYIWKMSMKRNYNGLYCALTFSIFLNCSFPADFISTFTFHITNSRSVTNSNYFDLYVRRPLVVSPFKIHFVLRTWLCLKDFQTGK